MRGSSFPNQGWSPRPLQQVQSLIHWTTRELCNHGSGCLKPVVRMPRPEELLIHDVFLSLWVLAVQAWGTVHMGPSASHPFCTGTKRLLKNGLNLTFVGWIPPWQRDSSGKSSGHDNTHLGLITSHLLGFSICFCAYVGTWVCLRLWEFTAL